MSELEREFTAQRRRLEAAYRALEVAWGHDADRFGARWRAQASAWPFDRLNQLIREHNEWYPLEANLPMDPRTCDYVPIRGASYRRVELGPAWVLEHFPPTPPRRDGRPAIPRRAPREPL
ncbi:MAG: hypothetical protein M3N16_02905 [Actinomycetota bacterium]|nr:hypothetical protein [Actinomycetota bacterium]